jgi:thiamine-phosphate diphosphorylase
MPRLDPRLYLVTDPDLIGDRDLVHVVLEAVAAGVTLVQLRDKDASDRDLLDAGRALKAALAPHRVPLLLNDRVELACALGVGVHVGQSDTSPSEARAVLGHDALIGLSIEFLDDPIDRAADYVAASPVFSTATKADAAPELGLGGLARLRRRTDLPLIGIGGIHEGNAAQVIEAGADGVAVISAILSASDLTRATRRLRQVIDDAKGDAPSSPDTSIPNALTVGLADPSAASGALADLKTFAALGVYGACALSALRAGSALPLPTPPEHLHAQLDALTADIRFSALKIGHLPDLNPLLLTHAALALPRVLAPTLRDREHAQHWRQHLLPNAALLAITPHDAALLLQQSTAQVEQDPLRAAALLRAAGPQAVLLQADSANPLETLWILDDGGAPLSLRRTRLGAVGAEPHVATLAAAMTALLARRRAPRQALPEALDYLSAAARGAAALQVGRTLRPLHHLQPLWER